MPTNSDEYLKKNYNKYRNNDKQREKSKLRMRARRKLVKEWRVKKGDGMQVDHIDSNVKNNAPSNLRVISEKKNKRLWAAKATRVKLAKKRKSLYVD